jgi:hypothetical protein
MNYNLATINYNTATFVRQKRKPVTLVKIIRKWVSYKIKTYKETPLPCFMLHYEEFSNYIPHDYRRNTHLYSAIA